jgi:hypothetical protein
MRQISAFVVTRTTENYPAILKNSFSIGLRYPYPHVYIFKGDEAEEEYSMLRLRPFGERCGSVRDSRLNNIGIGIVVKTDKEKLNEKAMTMVANIIKFIADDLCIDNYSIVSDEANPDKFVDTFGLEAKIALLPSSFTRNGS